MLRFLCFFLLLSSPAFAHGDHSHGPEEHGHGPEDIIEISKPYAFATAEGVKSGAIFMMIENEGDEALKLTKASGYIAETIEIHEMAMEDGVMKMREIEFLELPAGESVSLEPTGYHVMLIGLTEALEEGKAFPITLHFDNDHIETFDVPILAPGQKPE